MSSKGITIITPDVGTPTQDVQVFADGATNALLVKVVNPSSTSGGGTQYAEDAAHTTGDTGTMALVVRKDAAGTLAGTDGDYAPLQVDANGALRVVVTSGGGGGTQYAEDAAHTTGDTGTLALVVRNDTPGTLAGTDGDYAVLQVDATGRLRVAVDSAVSVAVTDGGGSLTVDGSVSVSNFPATYAVTQTTSPWVVDGTVAATQSGVWSVTVVDGGGSITVDGSVSVSNFPATYPVTDNGGSITVDGTVAATQSGVWSVTAVDGGGSLTVDGSVSVLNFPATQAVTQSTSPWVVSGTVAATQSGTWSVTAVDGGGSLTVDGSVSITGSVVVTDGAGSLTVDGTVAATQSGVWSVTVVDGGGSLTVDGSVSVSNFPATYPVTDNGGSLTVDGTVAATQSGAWAVSVSSMVDVTGSSVSVNGVRPGTAGNELGKEHDQTWAAGDVGVAAMAVFDTSGVTLPVNGQGSYTNLTVEATGRLRTYGGVDLVERIVPGTLAQDLGKAEDAGHVSGDTGVMALAVRQDTATALAGTGGDYIPLIVDGSGRLHTAVGAVTPGTAAANLGKAEDAVAASGDTGVMALAVRADTAAATAANGDYHPLLLDSTGRLHVNVGTVVPGTAATSLGKAEDAAHASGDTGVMSLAVRRDTLTSFAGTDGDYAPLALSSAGALWVREAGVTQLALSGSTRGRPIQITGTTSGGANTLHTATTTTGQLDRVWVHLTNTSANSVLVTIEFGTTGVGNEIDVVVPANATVLAVAGAVIGGAATDTIKAYAATGSVVNAYGSVERFAA